MHGLAFGSIGATYNGRPMKIPRNLYASHCYAAFNRRIDAVMPWVASAVRPFCGYVSQEVAWRFRQRCTELAVPGFMRICATGFARTGALSVNTGRVDCDGLRLEADGSITLSGRLFLRALAEFALHWLHALAAILLCLRLKPDNTASMTLVFGIGIENLIAGGSDARFLAYCRHGPVTPLAQAERLVVHSTQPIASTEFGRVRYHRFPLFAALRWRGLGPFSWSWGLAGHVAALVSFGWTVMRCPSAIILGRDAAYHAAAAALNRVAGIRTVVLTNSNHSAQALWTWALSGRRYRAHMVWYSENSVPIVYSDDLVDTPLSNFRFIKVDEMWVWTGGFKAFFEKLGCHAIYHVVGPILWYLPEAPEPQGKDEIRIAVFDVTPVRDDVALHIGAINNYYSTANMAQFIEDIVYACAETERIIGRRVRVLLKHKRSYQSAHDAAYISLIEKISGPGQAIELVSPDANMYSLISTCDLVLVIPYSSPAHVATSLGCPAIYYDPAMTVWPVFAGHPLLTFVAGREKLVKSLPQFLDAEGHGARIQQG